MNWTPYLAIWSFFAATVIVLAIYRKMLSTREDDCLHVSEGGMKLIPGQIAHAQKIEVIEKWGKSLTAVVLFAGLVLASIYFYGVFQAGAGVAVVK
jgi:hypothetical protein